ncbi:DNA repair protein RecO [bacterium]|nr:DNA repair protein RecO [bacterium]
MRVDLEPGFVLHTRAYRESSLLVDLLTEHHGRVSVVAKGARRQSRKKVTVQPFVPMIFSWMGKSSLKTLVSYEHTGQGVWLTGHRLYSALYINELLVYVLKPGESLDELYTHYAQLIAELASKPLEPQLRAFEFALLSELGLGIDLIHDAENGECVQDNVTYSLVNSLGFVKTSRLSRPTISINGRLLKQVAASDWQDPEVLLAAKHITRIGLSPLLENKTMNSRTLFH